ARLQHDDLQTREAVKDAELEQGRERLPYALGRQHIEIELRLADVLHVETPGEGVARFEGRMNAERNVEVLRRGEQAIVVGMAVRFLGDGERRYPRAAASVVHGSCQLLCRGRWIAEREMGDR